MLKSLIVAAPAGSGKTEELSRRYIDLLLQGVRPERILTLTFTDKAAAEMKQRILKRLSERYPAQYRDVRENILRLRISTIHSFCLGLLRRFAPHVGLDPALEALEDARAAALWNQALYDTLARIAGEPGTGDYRTLMDLVCGDKSQTWGKLTEQFRNLYGKRVAVEHAVAAPIDKDRFETLSRELRADPVGLNWLSNYKDLFPSRPTSEMLALAAEAMAQQESMFLTVSGTPRKQKLTAEQRDLAVQLAEYRQLLLTSYWSAEFHRMFDLFRRRFLAAYDDSKREAGTVDFIDMEHRALQVISEDEQWQNILYAFDEQTDHLLVDEFQDTSYLQWAIVRKLTEEWRSGEGAKAARGIEPTVFIVGDVKQSVYLFRDAKVEVFTEVREELRAALGDRLDEKPLRKNYRSLQAIIDFTNELFSRLMNPAGPTPLAWRTPYERFERGRKNDAPGRVEILIDRNDGNIEDRRRAEAEMVCRRIKSLLDPAHPLIIYDRSADPETARSCEYGDIAVLLRNRTHLGILAQVLTRHGIPFIAVGGTGFYSEPEVCHVRSLLSFLVDPTDGWSLYALLRGPLFTVQERDLLLANSKPGQHLWERLQSYAGTNPALSEAVTALRGWLGKVNHQGLAAILGQALSERKAWTTFWEPQRVANIRKFIDIIEGMELEGRHPLRILEFLEHNPDEKRADVSVETAKAVQILTVHGAKGLQFPVVFYTGCDAPLGSPNRDALLIEERGPELAWVSYIPDAGIRGANPFHAEFAEKEYEEEKRVFYVACTRAADALFLTGIWCKRRRNSTLSWLEEHLGLAEDGCGFGLMPAIPGVRCLSAQDIPEAAPAKATKKLPKPKVLTAPVSPAPAPTIRAVTRNLASDFQCHGEDAVGLGEVIHKLLEEISNGKLTADDQPLAAEIERLLRLNGLDVSLADSIQSTTHRLMSNVECRSIIGARPNSFAELPIMYSDGKTVYTGRVDRVIVTDDEVRMYDYKTFAVSRKELPELVRAYHDGQLRYYVEAMRKLYPNKKVSSFLIFTALTEVVPTGR